MAEWAVRTSGTPIDTVEFWSDVRLPFEPRGDMLDARNALRNALRSLDRKAPGFCAEYVSTDATFCDVENVLLYNVGASAFAGLGAKRISFWRTDASPPVAPDGLRAPHYHRYAVGQNDAPPAVEGRVLAEWRDVAFPRLTVAGVWTALRASDAARGSSAMPNSQLAMNLRVSHPPSNAPFGIVKQLLDAIISAFHSASVVDDECVRLLVPQRARDVGWIVDSLTDPSWNLLGARALVGRFRTGVKWNPADERLTLVHMEFATATSWSMSGTLFELT
jgi:hypothetical protein